MAKASMTLSDGTTVHIEGSPEEIQRILALHSPRQKEEMVTPKSPKAKGGKFSKAKLADGTDIVGLVSVAKDADDFELIESTILDRTSLVDRILLPLYASYKHVSQNATLTSGDMSKFLSQLGINIAQPNVARTLSSTALKYVIGDKTRKKGQAVRYRLSRRGYQYITAVIQGKPND